MVMQTRGPQAPQTQQTTIQKKRNAPRTKRKEVTTYKSTHFLKRAPSVGRGRGTVVSGGEGGSQSWRNKPNRDEEERGGKNERKTGNNGPTNLTGKETGRTGGLNGNMDRGVKPIKGGDDRDIVRTRGGQTSEKRYSCQGRKESGQHNEIELVLRRRDRGSKRQSNFQ